MSYTTDRENPELHESKGEGQENKAYLVLSEEERAKGFVRPLRQTYVHAACGTATFMSIPLAETYARNPKFYGATWCVGCRNHFPVSEFAWDGSEELVGS